MKMKIGYKSPCFFAMLILKWTIYGEFNDHRLHVSVLEEVPRVRQSGTLQFPAIPVGL
jgi:hypothetical protein